MSMWDRSAAMAPAPAPTAAAAAAGSGGGGMRADGAGSGAGSADADVGKAKKKRRQRNLALEQRKEVAMFAWRKGVDKACNHPKFMALGLKKGEEPRPLSDRTVREWRDKHVMRGYAGGAGAGAMTAD